MDRDIIFAGLNPEQRRAVEAVRGPGLHPCRGRLGQDHDDHAPDREPGCDRRVRGARDPRGHLHGQGGRPRCAPGSSGSASAASPPARSTRRRCASSTGSALRPSGSWPPRRSCSGSSANTLPPPFKFRPAGDLATEIEWAKNRRLTPGTYLDGIGEHEPPIPPDLMFRDLPRLRGREVRSRLRRLRGPARADDPALRRAAGRARGGARALPRVHRRRVPGRQPPAADAARPLARRQRRALRRRRRLPVDLRVHRRDPRLPPWAAGSVPARNGRQARGQLPLVARGARTGEPDRACSRRCREDPAADAAAGPRTADAGVPAARGGDGVRRRPCACAAERGRRARGDGRALPDERAAGRLRGAVPRRRDSVSGRVAARPRSGPPAAEAIAPVRVD